MPEERALRKFFRSSYVKAAGAMILAGTILLVLRRIMETTSFHAVVDKINSTLMPVYIGILLAFVLCPIYNAIVRKCYGFMKEGRDLNKARRERKKLSRLSERGTGSQGLVLSASDEQTGVDADALAKDKIIGYRKGFNEAVAQKKKEANLSEEDAEAIGNHKILSRARLIASICCLAIIFGVAALLIYTVLPQIVGTVLNLVDTAPSRLQAFAEWAHHNLYKYPQVVKKIDEVADSGGGMIITWIQTNILKKHASSIAAVVSSQIFAFVNTVINVFIGMLIAIYLLNYKERLCAIARKLTAANFSEKTARNIYEFANIINTTFIGFIVGRILDAIVIGVLTFMTMTIFQMPLALLISVIVGITNVIPFFGPFLGAIPSFGLLLIQGHPVQAIYFAIMILVIQQLDGNVIGPKIVGSVIGINSFWVLISVLIGGGLFGFIGMALGVPVFAVIYQYVNKIASHRLVRKEKLSATDDYYDFSKFGINSTGEVIPGLDDHSGESKDRK